MRRFATTVVLVVFCAGLALTARQTPSAPASAQQQAPRPQQPVFRSEVDVIRLDVSVLDDDRRPVRGLTAGDFSVFEDGKAQEIVAVVEIDAGMNDPVPSAWMRHVPRDVAANNLADQAGDGRVFAILVDDWNLPLMSDAMLMSTRAVAYGIIDRLGPSDVAAIVFPREPGKTEDFTGDRDKLLRAIEKIDRPEYRYIGPKPTTPTGGGADMPYRSSPALMRSECELRQPTVPTIHTLTARLASIPNRRKTLFLVSRGVPLDFGDTRGLCTSVLADVMKDAYRIAQRGNVNIYSVDPSGYGDPGDFVQAVMAARSGPAVRQSPRSVTRDFLEITAEYTGARAIVNTDDLEGEIERVFAEASSYYLVGYRSSNGKPDGKFRKLEVKVKTKGAKVRTRSGYYAPKEGSVVTAESKATPSSINLGLTGLMMPAALPLRAAVLPLARTAGLESREVDVGVVLTVRLPPLRRSLIETLTLVRTLYDGQGRPAAPTPQTMQFELDPGGGDEVRYDVYQRLTLAPGRYSIRLNGSSKVLDRSGSVYADFDVPDFSRAPVSMSAVVLGMRQDPATRTDALARVVPIVPTSARDFSANELPVAFLRIFQGGSTPIAPVNVTSQILDLSDTKVHDAAISLEPVEFDASRSAPFELALPIARLTRGPYLLSIAATLPGGATTRRDVVFRIR